VVPNPAFAEPYVHFSQPQQSVAIIGGYAARNMQIMQPSKLMRLNWVKVMQTSFMSLNAFT
jgi:hypothetical protein